MIEFVNKLSLSFNAHQSAHALCINDLFYTYGELGDCIGRLRKYIRQYIPKNNDKIGLVTHDDLETYASILALWFEGKAYVPVNPLYPKNRNEEILAQAECTWVLSSTDDAFDNAFLVCNTKNIDGTGIYGPPAVINDDGLAYILFTSGSTGKPKGVPITFSNLQGLVDGVNHDPRFNLNSSDKCLQMFELTFDFSLVTFVFPFLAGACIYTIPKGKLKYLHTFYLLQKYGLTVLTMVPSIIEQLQPYFSEIDAPTVRYCSFGGGKLLAPVAEAWQKCIPNSEIFNYYGPTEFTVYSGYYPYHPKTAEKQYNGAIAIGKPLYGITYRLVNPENNEVPFGEVGELCLAGRQTTPGYWKNSEKNKTSFFVENDAPFQRFYKTGDLCILDEEGDYLFYGRADFQVKVNGYRVELGEIEHQVKDFLPEITNQVIDFQQSNGHTVLGLALNTKSFNTKPLTDFLREKLPQYMVPSYFLFLEEFPLSINGKIDRTILRKQFLKQSIT